MKLILSGPDNRTRDFIGKLVYLLVCKWDSIEKLMVDSSSVCVWIVCS